MSEDNTESVFALLRSARKRFHPKGRILSPSVFVTLRVLAFSYRSDLLIA